MRLAGLRPKKGDSGNGVAARYRAADNTMAVSFEDPRKRVKEPTIQKVSGAQCSNDMLRSGAHQCCFQVQYAGSFNRCTWRPFNTHMRCCHQVQGFYRENGRNLCFEGTVRVCKIGKNSKGETKLFAPKVDGSTFIAGETGTLSL